MTLFGTGCKSKKATESTTTNQQQNKRERPQGNGNDPFTEMDINKDGLLTKAEAKRPIANDFAKIDLDGVGIITRAEFDKAPKPQREGGRPPQR